MSQKKNCKSLDNSCVSLDMHIIVCPWIFHYVMFMVHFLTCTKIYLQLEGIGKMIGVGKAKQYTNVLDKPLSRGRQEVCAVSTLNYQWICAHTVSLVQSLRCRSFFACISLRWDGDPF